MAETKKKSTSKKTSTKKTTTKKTTTKKPVEKKVVEEQKEVKKSEVKTKKKIDIIDIIMIAVIVAIGIYIISLGFKLKNVSVKKTDDIKANIVVPVLDKNTNSQLTLNMNEFKEDSVYVFKVTNYRNTDVNKEDIVYKIKIGNPDSNDISIYKNGSDKNLVDNSVTFTIDNNKLKGKDKQTDIYEVKLNSKDNLKDTSRVSISVES